MVGTGAIGEQQHDEDVFGPTALDSNGLASHSLDAAAPALVPGRSAGVLGSGPYGAQSFRGGGGVVDVLADDAMVEDIEDADLERELAAQGALPGDLAAKLAQYEMMMQDDADEC
jgi:hypothetical protein